MSSYQGTFSVQNNAGSVLTNVIVVHKCAMYVNTIAVATLDNGQTTPVSVLQSQSGSNDEWNVYFTYGGAVYYRTSKQCNFETEDASQNCLITLTASEFSVNLPVSSSCLNNSMGCSPQ